MVVFFTGLLTFQNLLTSDEKKRPCLIIRTMPFMQICTSIILSAKILSDLWKWVERKKYQVKMMEKICTCIFARNYGYKMQLFHKTHLSANTALKKRSRIIFPTLYMNFWRAWLPINEIQIHEWFEFYSHYL